MAEYRDVLLRPGIQRRHRLQPAEIDEILTAIVANAMVREPAASEATGPDSGDQHLRDLLAAVAEAVLVTGDAALLSESPAEISALSPRAWVDSVAE